MHDQDLDALLAEAESARQCFDSTPEQESEPFPELQTVCQTTPLALVPATPVPTPEPEQAPTRGRPVFDDPTDPEQIHAIAVRCKGHYVASGGRWVPITKKQAKIHAKYMKRVGLPVEAFVLSEASASYLYFS